MTVVSLRLHFYRPSGVDRVAIVRLVPSTAGNTVEVSRGKDRRSLGDAAVHGPYAWSDAEAAVAREVGALKDDGFLRAGLGLLLTTLEGKSKRKRALAARRLGWMREAAAVEPLLAAGLKATDDTPAIVDALGEIGDTRAIAFCRTVAAKKLLSRRRSGVEALRRLDDASGLADAKNVALARLPSTVRDALAECNEGDLSASNVKPLADVVLLVPIKDRGLAIDTLYEIGSPLCVAAACEAMIRDQIDATHMWRYAKSVFKRAMLRHDVRTFGWLAHGIEVGTRVSKGTTATVKSGLDGEMRETRVFGRATQAYMQRATWRYLRQLAKHRPTWYAYAAAETLVHYSHSDAIDPKGRYGAYSRAYLLHRILWGASDRYELITRRMRFRLKAGASAEPPTGLREEAFPELWDLVPHLYLRVLGGARLPVVHEFALASLRRAHMQVVKDGTHAEIVALVAAEYPPTAELGLEELRRRFDPTAPDWDLLLTLLRDTRVFVRAVGHEWLECSAKVWTSDATRVAALLGVDDPTTRAEVARHVVTALRTATPDARRALASAMLGVLRGPESSEDAHAAHAQIAAALATEVAALATTDDLIALLAQGSVHAKTVAARALATKDGAATALGVEQLVAMAGHELVALREASHALFRAMIDAIRADPSPLYAMLESQWTDTRAFAIDLLRTELDTNALTPEALIGLCDSNRADVQDLGKQLVGRRLQELDPQDLIKRLSQHPHRNMRRWTVDLTVKHLRDGFVPLAACEELFRTVLLDVVPDRAAKRAVVAFLAERGTRDERQAEVASRLLSELVRSKTKDEYERALAALARIKIAFPGVDAAVVLREEART
jgi:hypothetical protein